MTIAIMERCDVSYLDALLLDDQGRLRAVPAARLAAVPPPHLMLWANKRGAYSLPTLELLDWLRDFVRGRHAIEICAGEGAIGRGLGIQSTDSYMQTLPEIVAYYRHLGQTPITPPSDVARFEGLEAVCHYQPEVVIGSYVTQKAYPGDETGTLKPHCSAFGVDEMRLIPKVKAYVLIGNAGVHEKKRALALPHRIFRFDWLYTRSVTPEKNQIVVWGE